MARDSIDAGNTIVVEYTLSRYTSAAAKRTASDCTADVVEKIAVVTQIVVSVVAPIQTVVEVAVVAHVASVVVAAWFNGLLPSCSTCPFFFP